MKFGFIRDHAELFSVRRMCRVLQVSPSGYYAWMTRPECRRKREDRRLVLEIKAVHKANRLVYGSPRIHRELAAMGMRHGRKRIARLMRQSGIQAKQSKVFKVTTDSAHCHPVAPNLLGRNFRADGPDRKWLADITYVRTREGWLYLAAVLDLYSRSIVGWSMADHMSQRLVADALCMAADRRRPSPGLLHHSDQGRQYTSSQYRKALASYGMVCSMSRKGDCWDNAPMESFFHTLKTELVSHRDYQTRRQAKADIFEYIEVFYNRSRRHSALDYMSPAHYELATMTA